MMLSVADIVGLPGLPKSSFGVRKWLKKLEVCLLEDRKRFVFNLFDLPEDVRLAWWRRELDGLQLDPGTYDDAAHEALADASPTRRNRAERKAAMARMLTALRAQGVKEGDRFALVREKFGGKGTSNASLKRISTAVQGVDPINYAAALLDEYKATAKRAEFSEDAWRFFMTMIRDAAPEWPLMEAWRRVEDAGKISGWDVPSFPTFYRRWNELSEAQRMHARLGRDETAKRLTIPARRDKTSILPLEWVSLDGRQQDYWVDWGDGKAVRPVMLILVDAASNMVLDWELSPTENANATVRLIKRVCERFGIFDNLYPDNGSSFAGHRVAGGSPHRFRNGIAKGVQPLGICKIMGIHLHFALPKNAKAKIAERIFGTLSRAIDDGPEFKGAHAGHAPGASPSPDVVPVPVDTAREIIAEGIRRHNRAQTRRSQGARKRSYEDVMRAGMEEREQLGRPLRRATADQLYLAGLHWKAATVDRNTQITVGGWTYGGPETRQALAPYRKGEPKNPLGGVKIIFGRDPDNFGAPGIAFDEDGNPICRNIEPVKAGKYGSEEGVRQAARNRQAAMAATKAAEAANDYLEDAAYREAMAAVTASVGTDDTPLPPRKIVGARFGAVLRERGAQSASENDLDQEAWNRKLMNFDRATNAGTR